MKLGTYIFTLFLLLTTFPVFADSLHKVAFSADELQQLSGHYSSVFGYVHIQAKNKKLSTVVNGKHIHLVKKSDGKIYPFYNMVGLFPISIGGISLSFQTINGKQNVTLYKDNEIHRVAKQFTVRAIPASWKALLGHYHASVVKGKPGIKTVHLKQLNGVLLASINQQKDYFPLVPLSATQAFLPDTGNEKSVNLTIRIKDQNLHLAYANNEVVLRKTSPER